MSMFTTAPKFVTATPAGVAPREEFAEYDSYAVTPADGTDLPAGNSIGTKALYVTGAGNVNCNLVGGGTAVLTGLAAGQLLPIAVTRVLSTSTTATGILALY
jgi:hypothetical protein